MSNKSAKHRKAQEAALKKESERALVEQIRRLLALPMNKRTHFLRVRRPGGGSHLQRETPAGHCAHQFFMNPLHENSVVIDGLIVSKWSRAVFEDMRKGGLTAANCTVSIWEDFSDTVHQIADMKRHIRAIANLLTLVRTTADIHEAKRDGKTGIILGFQNAHAFEDRLEYIESFADMGVRIVQLCYNTQNLIGCGCYERDGGLSDFGREVIAEMNRVGIMVDLSHVGAKTSEEAILESNRPVTYSHCLPSGLKAHPRNKSNAQLKFIADHGGFIGVTMNRIRRFYFLIVDFVSRWNSLYSVS